MKRILTVIILFVLFSAGIRPARADGDPIEIWTADDLLKIAESPSETYCLMADIDMDGIPWLPLRSCAFRRTLWPDFRTSRRR